MNGDHWIIRNPGEAGRVLGFFQKHLEERNQWPICWAPKKYTAPRSLPQNALFQKWAREYVQHLLKVPAPSDAQHEAMKITLKRAAYTANGWPWLLEEVTDLFTRETSKRLRSSTKYDKGEMHMFLNWVQAKAADDGLILESLGEYRELQERQVA